MQNKTQKIIAIHIIVSTIFGILGGIAAIPFIADFVILFFLRAFGVQFSVVEKLNIPISQNNFIFVNVILLTIGLVAFLTGLSLMYKIKGTTQHKKLKLYFMIGQIGGILSVGAAVGNIILLFFIGFAIMIGG
jgi:hypothetical protein